MYALICIDLFFTFNFDGVRVVIFQFELVTIFNNFSNEPAYSIWMRSAYLPRRLASESTVEIQTSKRHVCNYVEYKARHKSG
jgi:hypothetical protein